MMKIKLNIKQELAADGRPTDIEQEFEAPYPFDAEKISISNKTFSLETLIRRIKQKTITSPLIQRGAGIWGNEQQSRLIESLMLKIPLPLFYVAADENEKWYVVDGLQRMTAIRRYIIDQEFTLSGLEFMGDEYNNRKFDQLPVIMQNRIIETQLSFAVINPSTPQNVQRNIFKRLNTGGLPLTSQEIRHALYYGKSALLLADLAHSKDFKQATDGRVDDSRMGARELVLRFLSFLIRGVEEYPKNEDMDAFLSETMQLVNIMPDLPEAEMSRIFGKEKFKDIKVRYCDLSELNSKFSIAMIRAKKLFGRFAFRKSTPLEGYRTPINKSLFEAWSLLLSEMDEDKFELLHKNKQLLYKHISHQFHQPYSELERYISRDSHKKFGIDSRYRIINEIIEKVIRGEKCSSA